MWFGSPEKNSMIPTNPPRGEGVQYNLPVTNPTETILQALNTTTCFDLMRNSSKVKTVKLLKLLFLMKYI